MSMKNYDNRTQNVRFGAVLKIYTFMENLIYGVLLSSLARFLATSFLYELLKIIDYTKNENVQNFELIVKIQN